LYPVYPHFIFLAGAGNDESDEESKEKEESVILPVQDQILVSEDESKKGIFSGFLF